MTAICFPALTLSSSEEPSRKIAQAPNPKLASTWSLTWRRCSVKVRHCQCPSTTSIIQTTWQKLRRDTRQAFDRGLLGKDAVVLRVASTARAHRHGHRARTIL